MLTKVFTKEFRNPNNQHLSAFYTIVPPLTINYVEHMLGLTDQLAKEVFALLYSFLLSLFSPPRLSLIVPLIPVNRLKEEGKLPVLSQMMDLRLD